MPTRPGETYPDASHVVDHLTDYEKRYDLPVQHGTRVRAVTWATRRPSRFLADDSDGRVLFDVATARRRALDAGRGDSGGVAPLGDIVAVPPVRAARDAGLLTAKPMFTRLTATGVQWADGGCARADAVVWCAGSRAALGHLAPLAMRRGAVTSRPLAREPSRSRACTYAATATGPGPPPPPSSAWAAPHVTPPKTSRGC